MVGRRLEGGALRAWGTRFAGFCVGATIALSSASAAVQDENSRTLEEWEERWGYPDVPPAKRWFAYRDALKGFERESAATPDAPEVPEWLALAKEHAVGADWGQQYLTFVWRSEAKWYRNRELLDEACRVLEDGLAALSDSPPEHRALAASMLGDLAESAIRLGRLGDAGVALRRADDEIDRGACTVFAPAEIAGFWVEYHLKCGRPDRAWDMLDKEEERVQELEATLGPENCIASRLAWLQHFSDVCIADKDFQGLVFECDRRLRSNDLVVRKDSDRSILEGRLGIALKRLEVRDPERPRRARGVLEDALRHGASSSHAIGIELALAEIALRDADPETAAKWAASVSARVPAGRVDKAGGRWVERARVAAYAARVAVAAGADEASLREALAALELEARRFLDRWRVQEQTEVGAGLGVLHYPSRQEILGAWIDLILHLDSGEAGRERALLAALEFLEHGWLARQLAAPEPREVLAALRAELLPPDGGVLIYVPSRPGSHVFAVDASGIAHASLPDADLLDLAREKLIGAIVAVLRDEGDEAAIDTASATLGEALLPPALLDRMRGWRSLTLTGLETFGYAPFEFLPGPGGGLLGDELPIVYAPSPAVHAALLRRAPARGEHSLDLRLFAAPEHGPLERARWPSVESLAWDDAREEDMIGAYPPGRTLVYSRERATIEQFLAADSGDASVLQVYAHGVGDHTLERPATFLLAGDASRSGCVTFDHILSMQASPLVLLTTCGAARGPLRRGQDGGTHLGGAYLAAGARTVLLSNLDVAEKATRALMGRFNERLRVHGESPAVALWRARLALAEDPRFARPELRALVHAYGTGFEPVFEPLPRTSEPLPGGAEARDSRWLLLFGAAIATAVAGYLIGRRRRAA